MFLQSVHIFLLLLYIFLISCICWSFSLLLSSNCCLLLLIICSFLFLSSFISISSFFSEFFFFLSTKGIFLLLFSLDGFDDSFFNVTLFSKPLLLLFLSSFGFNDFFLIVFDYFYLFYLNIIYHDF